MIEFEIKKSTLKDFMLFKVKRATEVANLSDEDTLYIFTAIIDFLFGDNNVFDDVTKDLFDHNKETSKKKISRTLFQEIDTTLYESFLEKLDRKIFLCNPPLDSFDIYCLFSEKTDLEKIKTSPRNQFNPFDLVSFFLAFLLGALIVSYFLSRNNIKDPTPKKKQKYETPKVKDEFTLFSWYSLYLVFSRIEIFLIQKQSTIPQKKYKTNIYWLLSANHYFLVQK